MNKSSYPLTGVKIVLVEAEGVALHKFEERHLEKIRAVDRNIEAVLVSSADQEEINRQLEDADVLAGTLWAIPPIRDVKNLKWIHSFSAGVDRILTREIKASDVLVGNCSGIHAIPIAEHILGFLLIFTRKFYATFENQQKKIWEKQSKVTELRGKTVLLVGLGHIGREAARLISCVGATVLAVDRRAKEKPDFVAELYPAEQLHDALAKADFVVLCLPYTRETHQLFDREKFRAMKKTAVLVNIGRGGLVAEQDLVEALRQKVIAGAALDVTEIEPLPEESPLWNMDNVVITPHHSGWSEHYMDRAVDLFCLNLQAFLRGELLPNLVDKEKGY